MRIRLRTLFMVGLWTLACFPARAQNGPPVQTQQVRNTPEDWVRENYEVVLDRVFPERLELSPFPQHVKWILVVLASNSLTPTSEYWFSFENGYDGSVRVTVRIPRESSLSRQMQELKEKMPQASNEEVVEKLQVSEYQITEKQLPELKQLAKKFEGVRMSPVVPDTLIADPYAYHFWTESLWGQEMSVYLIGIGPTGKRQPHPLVAWAEQVRTATENYIHQSHLAPKS
jgi:hypothetical protein